VTDNNLLLIGVSRYPKVRSTPSGVWNAETIRGLTHSQSMHLRSSGVDWIVQLVTHPTIGGTHSIVLWRVS
jgi:hypothetical protein